MQCQDADTKVVSYGTEANGTSQGIDVVGVAYSAAAVQGQKKGFPGVGTEGFSEEISFELSLGRG